MIDSRNIDDLHPVVAKKCREFIAACAKEGITVRISSTYRDHARQAALFAQGRTRKGKIVTYARPGDSWHNWRMAFDFFPVKKGKVDWNDLALFRRCRKIGEGLGLEGLSFELAHLQYRGGLTIADMKRGKRLPE
jgi:peptidoglycan LD-endopeptidase CwlK